MRLLFAASCLLALAGCAIIVTPNDGDVHLRSVFGSDTVAGNGQPTRETRPVGNLQALDVNGSIQVDVRVGAAPSLEVEADSNLLPMIRTEVRGGTLRIWIEGNVRSNNALRVSYSVPQLTQLHANGSGRVMVSELNGAPLVLDKNGSGTIQLAGRVASFDARVNGSGQVNATALQTGNVNVHQNGSGRMNLGAVRGDAVNVSLHGSGGFQASGAAQALNVRVHGSGGADLAALSSQQADLAATGSGDISAMVKGSLIAETSGSGRITVYGNPAQRNVSGRHVQVLN
jgi:hypothetical protein